MAADTRKHKVYIDFLKIVAIYLVLFTHTWDRGFVHFTAARGELLYPLYLAAAIIIKIAVPLFFMSSGALLLGKEESYKALLLNRFLKYLIVLVLGSAIGYWYACMRTSKTMIAADFFKTLYTSQVDIQFWYLYSYLAYILMLPLLRKLAQAMTIKEYKWLFLMYGLMQGLRILDYLLWNDTAFHNGYFSFFIYTDYVFYSLMGYCIDNVFESAQFNRKNCLLLILASIMGIIVCGCLTHYRCTINDRWDESYCQELFGMVIFILAITVFYTAKMWFQNHTVTDRITAVVKAISGTTFGIYLFDPIWRMQTIGVFDKLEPYIGTFPACMVWILVACLSGGIVIYFVKKIPGVKKFI